MSAKITKKLSKKIDKLTNQWTISANAESIEEEVQKQLNTMQLKVHIDGFRVGKAPIKEVDRLYGEDALYRAVNTIIRNSINEIINEEKYDLAMQPEVSFNEEIKRNKDISVVVKLTKKPQISDIKYEKIEVELAELELSEKDKEDELMRFRRQMAKPILASDKVVEDSDIVDIDFIGKKAKNNVEFAGGSANNYRLEIGSHSFISNFEEQIIGHKKGETFDIKVKFPDTYPSNELKGEEAIFTVTINDIYVKELPEINDNFVKNLGFENIEKFKQLLFQNMENIYNNNAKNLLKNDVFNMIIKNNKIDLPESIIEKEVDERLEHEKEINKDNKKWNEKDARKKIEEDISKSYSSFYLTDYIAKKNNIEVSDEEIKQAATQDAIKHNIDIKEVLNKIDNDEKTKNYIYFTIKESKVFDFIFDNIKKKIKKLDKKSFEKFLEEKSNR